MSKIRIKHFGPIKLGYQNNDGWIDVKKITVFIGNQGSGKSTVAKLISTLSWLEKAFVKGELRENELSIDNRFREKHCAYQKLENYFKENSEIEYHGDAYTFEYKNGAFNAHKNPSNGYLLPKIMYVPAERNFVSAVDRPDKLKNLPRTLVTFLDEYEKAKDALKEGLKLPINDVLFEYDKPAKIARIRGEGYMVGLSEASSGFQSAAPLYLVSRNLSLSVTGYSDPSYREISSDEQKIIQIEIERILLDDKLSEDVKQASLRIISSKYKVGCFINIVEEPEQNLFPSSQRGILNSLLEFANLSLGNKLILTTQSPYIINYLTLAIKGKEVYEMIEANHKDNLIPELSSFVPIHSLVGGEETVVYELDDDGKIAELEKYHGLPSDDNELNQRMAESNQLFAGLLEIEDQCR
jgi:predicted ATPase